MLCNVQWKWEQLNCLRKHLPSSKSVGCYKWTSLIHNLFFTTKITWISKKLQDEQSQQELWSSSHFLAKREIFVNSKIVNCLRYSVDQTIPGDAFCCSTWFFKMFSDDLYNFCSKRAQVNVIATKRDENWNIRGKCSRRTISRAHSIVIIKLNIIPILKGILTNKEGMIWPCNENVKNFHVQPPQHGNWSNSEKECSRFQWEYML
jgi:hypothetical protein